MQNKEIKESESKNSSLSASGHVNSKIDEMRNNIAFRKLTSP